MGDGPPKRRPLLLLAPATFFEGYDNFLLALALPLIRDDFGLTVDQAGLVASVAFAGSFGVLLLLPLADRIGRRRLLLITIAGYTAATVATAFSDGVVDLAALQFVARIFLGTEFALASIVLVESAPPDRRGRQLAVLTSSATLGIAAAGGGFLLVLATESSWRLLYLVGAGPLLLVAWARRGLPETLGAASRRLQASLRSIPVRHLAGGAGLAFLFAVFATSVTTFATLLVLDEWGWTVSDLRPQYLAVWGAGLGGFFVAGRLMDSWGRRPTTAVFMAGASAAAALAFTAGGTAGRVIGLGLVVFALTGASPCAAAYATELFPRAVRGRAGAVLRAASIGGGALAPALTGVLAAATGSVGHGLAFMGSAGVLAAGVVLLALPETRRTGSTATGAGI